MEKKRGFAAMSAERLQEIASMGGKACHAKGTGHQFTRSEAQRAGRLGGKRSGEARRAQRAAAERAEKATVRA